jgi:hypothetical protein
LDSLGEVTEDNTDGIDFQEGRDTAFLNIPNEPNTVAMMTRRRNP